MSAPAARRSFAEATPRERLAALLDPDSFVEFLDPFARVSSPHLAAHDLVAQRDDGVVVGRGRIAGADVAAVAIDGRFLGGSLGEIGGAKIAAVLERASGGAVIAFDTGGIRLQEANLGILAIAEICDAIVELRARAPVVAVIAGRIGAYGGMSIAAALCSTIVMSAGARFGLNGPDVVEQEAGIGELDARDRPRIWQLTGGVQRVAQAHADALIADDTDALAQAVRAAFTTQRNAQRTDPARLRNVFADASEPVTGVSDGAARANGATGAIQTSAGRGRVWAEALFESPPAAVSGFPDSVRVFDGTLAGQPWRTIAVVPNPAARYPRARGGELGLDEGLAVAAAVASAPPDVALLAIVDVPGQAFGAVEEAAGIHLALAASVEAYATARRGGRQVFALVVGRAISGAFLAHGLQAGWIGALRDPGIEVHVMSAASVARVTRATPDDVARVATLVPATARDIETFATFGAVDALFDVRDPLAPAPTELAPVRAALHAARAANLGLRAPRERLTTDIAVTSRAPAQDVRSCISAAWDAL